MRAENGLVHRDRAVAETTDQRSKLGQPLEPVRRLVPVEDMKRDDELFERGPACAFAKPVGAAMHHFGAGFDAGELRRHRHPEVVVRMNFDWKPVRQAPHLTHHLSSR